MTDEKKGSEKMDVSLEGDEPSIENKLMSKFVNYIFAILFTGLFAALAIFTLKYSPIPSNWAFITVIIVISFYFVGYLGFRKLEIGFSGVPVIFGQRIRNITLSEGWVWLISFIMEIKSIDVREQTKDIRETIVTSKDNAQVRVNMRAYFQIIDPYQSLSVEDEMHENDETEDATIEDGLQAIIISELRRIANENTVSELIHLDEEIGREIKEQLKKLTSRWGIKIIDVAVLKIVAENEDMTRALEKKAREEHEKAGERVEVDHFIQSVDKISDNNKRMSPEIAAAFFATERGKESPVRKVMVEGDENNPLVKAAGLANDGLVNQPSDKGGK